ncbi:ABC transporter ATP-binding protein [Umezawaea sp. NPDC059074]|uniref:ABC transporter ATP-binding protein n=1 Tax=Umezawaea sp. NPDC059074 TaxID=3346716 RepID=UPI0036A9B2E2
MPETTATTLRVFGEYLRPYRGGLVSGAALLVASSALGLVQPLAARDVIEALGVGTGLAPALVRLTVLVLLAAVALGVGDYLVLRAAEGVTLAGRVGLVRRVLRLTVPAMRTQTPGDLLARVASDTSVLRQVASQAVVQVLTGAVMLVGALVLMGTVDLVLLGSTAAVVLVVVVLIMGVMPPIRRAALRAQESLGGLVGALEPALGAFTTVKASGAESAELARVEEAATTAYRQGVRLATWGSVAGTATGLAVQVAFLVVLGVGGARVASGAMPVADLVAYLLYVAYLTAPLMQMIGAGTMLQAARASVGRITEIAALPSEPLDVVPPAPAGPGAAEVVLDGLRFTYPGRDTPALDGVDLLVEAGSLTAVVGPSGSGKSTVFALIERFYQPDSGRVLVDGRDVADHDLAALRASIGYVEQDTPVLGGTLRENLAYATPGVGDAELREIIRTTRLDDLLDLLGGDLDAPILHRGVSLSGGERQRIAIARALLRKPRLLLLDEATSQLDAVNEAALRDVVRDVADAGTTVVVVAHRLSTVLAATRIVVLQDGKVRAVGTHDDLVRTDDLYGRLAAGQLVG